MFSQDGSRDRLDFAERDGSHPGSLESEGESADAGKEVEDIHGILVTIQSRTRSYQNRTLFRQDAARNFSKTLTA